MVVETGNLYEGVVPERAEPKLKLEDSMAEFLVKKWWEQAKSTPLDQRDEIGKIYISKFLGLGDEKANAFAQNNQLIFREVGNALWNVQPEVTTPFWYRIGELFPCLHTPDEVSYLTCGDKLVRINNVNRFITTFEEYPGDPINEPSRVLRNLSSSACTYRPTTA